MGAPTPRTQRDRGLGRRRYEEVELRELAEELRELAEVLRLQRGRFFFEEDFVDVRARLFERASDLARPGDDGVVALLLA